jgi:predicted metal-binding membrane protein
MAVTVSSGAAEIRPGEAPADRRRELAVYFAAVGVFAAAAVLTVYFTRSMSGGMEMPGGWSMSMAWMPMGGWLASGAMFAAMWVAMMVAMMLPSTLPMLLLYRRVQSFRGAAHLGALCWLVGSGYFLVWLLFGMAAFVAGTMMARAAMQWETFSRAVPVASGMALVVAGVYQLTPWKSACLRHCRDPLLLLAGHVQGGWRGALRLGLHHGAFCAACCWALMLIQLTLGVMSLAVMAVVAAVIALEKLLPRGLLVARLTGAAAIAGGLFLAVRAL